MSGIDADFSQYDHLAIDLGRSGFRITRKALKTVEKATLDTDRDWQALCPVDTGNLKNSGVTEVRGLVGMTGPTADYAPYVNDGTSRMAGRHFVDTAFETNLVPFLTAMDQLAAEVLK